MKKAKKTVSLILTAAMLLSIIITAPTTASAAGGVQAKIDTVRAVYPNSCKYFTRSGNQCTNASGEDCKLQNIPARGGLPSGASVSSWGCYSCYAFAEYVFAYTFGKSFRNYSTAAKPVFGDVIRVVGWYGESHYGIYLGEDANYYYVFDGNGDGKCGVQYNHALSKSEHPLQQTYHASNYNDIDGEPTDIVTTPTLTTDFSGNKVNSANDIIFSWSTVSSNMSGYNLYVAKNIAGTVNYDWDNGRIYCPGSSTNRFTIEKGKLSAGSYAAFVQAINIDTNEKSPQSNYIFFVVEDSIISDIHTPYDGITIDLSENNFLSIRGWAVNTGRYEVDCYATIDEREELFLQKSERTDVSTSPLYSCYCSNSNVGFQSQIDVSELSGGKHNLKIIAKSTSVNAIIADYSFTIINKTEPTATQQTTVEPTESTSNEPIQPTTVKATETIKPTEPTQSTTKPTEITEPTQPSTTKSTEPIETQPTTVKPTEPTEPTPATEEKTDISKWQVSGIYNKQYTGKYIKQDGITVYNDGEYADIKVKYRNNLNAGTATVIIIGTGDYTGTITKTFKINKAENPMLTWRDTEAVSSKALKKHKAIVKGVIGAYDYQGSVTFTKLSGSKSLTISKGGVITVKKGRYKKNSILSMKVKITAKGNSNYMSKSKKMTVKIKIK